MKHTPGPWNVKNERQGKGKRRCIYPRERIHPIAIISGDPHSAKENEANAALIAAAPDLLAASEEVIRQADMGIDADDPDNWNAAEITRRPSKQSSRPSRKRKGKRHEHRPDQTDTIALGR